jgi:hypothetical protein
LGGTTECAPTPPSFLSEIRKHPYDPDEDDLVGLDKKGGRFAVVQREQA